MTKSVKMTQHDQNDPKQFSNAPSKKEQKWANLEKRKLLTNQKYGFSICSRTYAPIFWAYGGPVGPMGGAYSAGKNGVGQQQQQQKHILKISQEGFASGVFFQFCATMANKVCKIDQQCEKLTKHVFKSTQNWQNVCKSKQN